MSGASLPGDPQGTAAHAILIGCGAQSWRIEYAWTGVDDRTAPVIVFLHEGLGSVSAWRAFPAALCAATGSRGLVYSRPGYGRSTPRASDEHWPATFMHHHARAVLPALLDALEVKAPVWLFGHSDGASIALLFAAAFAARTCGVIALAPHIFVEAVAIASIEAARRQYLEGELKARLARHHQDPDSAFFGWNDVWLSPAFRSWSIEAELADVACPVLAMQGMDDEYGTMDQVDGVAQRVAQAQLVKLSHAGHALQRDQPAAVIAHTVAFLSRHGARAQNGC